MQSALCIHASRMGVTQHNGEYAFPRLRRVASHGAGFAPPSSHDDFGRLAVPLAGVSSIELLSGSSVPPFVLAALADGTKNGCTTIMVIELVILGAVKYGVASRSPFDIAIVA